MNRRQNRKCGACAACLRRMDCGRCDFCCDKPKFGGSNQKRQKCRWRQCLQFAMVGGAEEGLGGWDRLGQALQCLRVAGRPGRWLGGTVALAKN